MDRPTVLSFLWDLILLTCTSIQALWAQNYKRRFTNVFFTNQEETKPNRGRKTRDRTGVKMTHSYYVNYTCANFPIVLIQHIASVLLCGPVLSAKIFWFCSAWNSASLLLSSSVTARSRDGYCTSVASGRRINSLCWNGRLTLWNRLTGPFARTPLMVLLMEALSAGPGFLRSCYLESLRDSLYFWNSVTTSGATWTKPRCDSTKVRYVSIRSGSLPWNTRLFALA